MMGKRDHLRFDEALSMLEAEARLRDIPSFEPSASSPVEARINGQSVVLFSTNDYLGLSHHPQVRSALSEAVARYGMGPRASPLVAGHTHLHEALEHQLARLAGHESALLFPSGYAANAGVLFALGDARTAIYSDALNHASIIDGCRAAKKDGAEVHVYRHRDLDHLESLLVQSGAARKIIVTETVFSMEGDLAPLAGLVALARRHDAMMVVDEGHGTLVHGPRGAGLAEDLGLTDHIDVHIGTLSKAAAGQGGFVASSAKIRRWILNRARSFIYSTALPVPVVAAVSAAIGIGMTDGGHARDTLRNHRRALGEYLARVPESAIVPIVLHDERAAMEASAKLLRAGLHVPGIRPPTVPAGTSRLRITLSAAHTATQVANLGTALRALGVVSSSR